MKQAKYRSNEFLEKNAKEKLLRKYSYVRMLLKTLQFADKVT